MNGDQAAKHAANDRRNILLLLALVLPCYSWFFHGASDVQRAHFNTIRALVEGGVFQIDGYGNATGDISVYQGKIYSNKPPGLPVLGAIVYVPLHFLETQLGWSASDPDVSRFNEYLVGLWCSALPGAAVSVVLYAMFRRKRVAPEIALLLAGAFAFGSLIFPYAGALTAHNFNALGVILPWALITSLRPSIWKDGLAGAVVGVAITTNYLMAPIAGLLCLFVLWERPRLGSLVALSAGPVIAIGLLMWFSALNFGSPFATSNTYQPLGMSEPGKLFGMFGWPDVRMIYWLTFHPFRGVFYYCPVLLLGMAGAIIEWRTLRKAREIVPLLAVLYFFIANACFNGWTGGWFAGPRYLIPAMPMLFLYAPAAYAKYPRLSWVLIVISIFNMLAVASVRVVFPAPSFGPPPPLSDSFSNPVAECYRRWTFNQVARQVASFNLGILLGLKGVWSIVPAALTIIVFFSTVWMSHIKRAPHHSLNAH